MQARRLCDRLKHAVRLAPRNHSFDRAIMPSACRAGRCRVEAPIPRPHVQLGRPSPWPPQRPDPSPVASAVTIPAAGHATADGRAGPLSDRERRSWRCWPAARATPDRRAAVPVGEHVRSHLERIRDKTGTRRPAELSLPHPGRHRPSRALRLTAGLPWPMSTSRRSMGRSAHTWRARWGRVAPAVRLWAGSRWVYRSASRRDREEIQ